MYQSLNGTRTTVRSLKLVFLILGLFIICCCLFVENNAAGNHVNILILVSVGHVVENARLVDVDGAAMVVPSVCEQAVSFVVVHRRSFSHQIHHSTRGCIHTRRLLW